MSQTRSRKHRGPRDTEFGVKWEFTADSLDKQETNLYKV